jgi:hypothetical protein
MLRFVTTRKESPAMAKKKRKAPKSNSTLRTAVKKPSGKRVAESEVSAEQFVGQWNRLVSTTNWEKGRIICQWREALMTSGAGVTEYSDEAWAQLVGGVTSQHVGRLRRVFQRFGEDHDQYEGLYWSHFQAGLEWDDAEMWLEGAIHNDWSVSQMRGKRWETLGTSPEQQQAEMAADQLVSEPEPRATPASAGGSPPATSAALPKSTAIKQSDNEKTKSSTKEPPASTLGSTKRTRLEVDEEQLPDDLAEAFEAFKLAIIAHRREGWTETTPDEVVKCLDALRDLALAEK